MSKSDRDLNQIDLAPSYKGPRSPRWKEDRPVKGLDTETYEGDVFAISKSSPKDEKTLYNPDGVDKVKLFKFLTTTDLEESINVFYNLSFDSQAIAKNICSEDQLERLSLFNEVLLSENWKVLCIPSKILSISQGQIYDDYFKRERTWTYFDASQFFRSSLENASQEWLSVGKADREIEISEFERKDYRVNKKKQISKYCEQDAKLVRRLYDKFSQASESLNIPAGWPVSTGALAEQFYRVQFDQKIKYPNSKIAEMAWDSYHGGRFEVIERGLVGETVTYDINSAYPSHASKLADPYALDWYKSTDLEDFKTGDYGFIRATVTTSEAPIQPFAVKSKELNKLIFPRLINTEITVPQQLFIYALEQGLIDSYEIKEGYTTRPAKVERPFNQIQELYRKRKEYEKEGKDLLAKVLKIIMNSIYGKTAQITKQLREIDEDYQLADHEKILPKDFLPSRVDGKLGTIIKSFKAGRWFNPVIATYITALTRLQLLKFIYDNGVENQTVMLATDSLTVKKSKKFDPELSSQLGGWETESSGLTYIIGAGVYEIFPDAKKSSDIKDGDNHITKARGFSKYEGGNKSLYRETAKLDGDKTAQLEVAQDRPVSSAEALWGARDFSSIADFEHSFRHISPNMDDKRDWPNPVSFLELTGESQRSTYRTYTSAGLYQPEKLSAGGTGLNEESKSRPNEIYDQMRKDGVAVGKLFDTSEDIRGTIGEAKWRQLVTSNDPRFSWDEWASHYGMSQNELVKMVAQAELVKDREVESDYDKRVRDHYQRLEYLDNM